MEGLPARAALLPFTVGVYSVVIATAPAKQYANPKRYRDGGVRLLFNDAPDEILRVAGALLNHLGRFRGGVLGLAVEILRGAGGLIDQPFRLAPGITGGAAVTLF